MRTPCALRLFPKDQSPLLPAPGFVGWKLEKFDIFKGARTAFCSLQDWFLAGVWAGGDRQATFSVA